MNKLATRGDSWEADWAIYVLFEGKFAKKLIDMGRADAVARASEIRAFFAPQAPLAEASGARSR